MKPKPTVSQPFPRGSRKCASGKVIITSVRARWFAGTGILPADHLFNKRDVKRTNQKTENYTEAWNKRRAKKGVTVFHIDDVKDYRNISLLKQQAE